MVNVAIGHNLTWKDDEIVGYHCIKSNRPDSVSIDNGWVTCPGCGLNLRLHYDVWLEEETND